MGNPAQAAPLGRHPRQVHVSVQRYFEMSLLLMLATAFLTVVTTGKLDIVSILVVLVAMGVKFWSHLRGADISLAPKTVTRISIFYIFFYALDFLIFSSGPTLIDRMLAATVHLVLFTALIKIVFRAHLPRLRLSRSHFIHDDAGERGTDHWNDVSGFLYALCSLRHFNLHQLRNQARDRSGGARARRPLPPARAESPRDRKGTLFFRRRSGTWNFCPWDAAFFRDSPLPHRLPHGALDAGAEHHGILRNGELGRYPQDHAIAHGRDAGDTRRESKVVSRGQMAGRYSQQL